jgi:hypothetical protein
MDDEDDDGKVTIKDIQAPSVTPRSLLSRTKEAVKGASNVSQK